MINHVETRDTEQLGKFKMLGDRKEGQQLVPRFVGGLRQQSQFTLNLFRLQTISEAHQQAMTLEAQ